jgi:hypothetical protein
LNDNCNVKGAGNRAASVAAVLTGMLVLALGLAPGHTRAEADGPDCYRVTGVAANDVLQLRDGPNPEARSIGSIPADATGLRNLGCQGGLTLQEFSTLSQAEKDAIQRKRPRWCNVDYRGQVGWVAGRFLAEGPCD